MRILSSAVILAVAVWMGTASHAVQAQGAKVTPEQLEATMKSIQQANGAMQKAVKGNMLADAEKSAQELVKLFETVEAFWTEYKKDDAVQLAKTGKQGAMDVLAAIKAGDQAKAAMAAGNIGGTCKQCHGMYREGNPQEGFRIKAGVI